MRTQHNLLADDPPPPPPTPQSSHPRQWTTAALKLLRLSPRICCCNTAFHHRFTAFHRGSAVLCCQHPRRQKRPDPEGGRARLLRWRSRTRRRRRARRRRSSRWSWSLRSQCTRDVHAGRGPDGACAGAEPHDDQDDERGQRGAARSASRHCLSLGFAAFRRLSPWCCCRCRTSCTATRSKSTGWSRCARRCSRPSSTRAPG